MRMTLTRVSYSEVLTEHELLKLSSFVKMLLGLVPRDTSVTVVIKTADSYSSVLD